MHVPEQALGWFPLHVHIGLQKSLLFCVTSSVNYSLRYQSLHRSFRRSNEDRPSVACHQPRLAPSSSITGGIDNMSLTLTLQEAEAMLRSQTSNRNSGGRSLLSRNGRYIHILTRTIYSNSSRCVPLSKYPGHSS